MCVIRGVFSITFRKRFPCIWDPIARVVQPHQWAPDGYECMWLWIMRMALRSVEVATCIVPVLSEHLIPLVAIALLRFHHTVLPKSFAWQIFHPPQIPLHCRNIHWNNCPCGNDHHIGSIAWERRGHLSLKYCVLKAVYRTAMIYYLEIFTNITTYFHQRNLSHIFLCIYIQDAALVNTLYWSGFDKDTTAVIHMSLGVCQRTAKCEVNSSPLRYSSLF